MDERPAHPLRRKQDFLSASPIPLHSLSRQEYRCSPPNMAEYTPHAAPLNVYDFFAKLGKRVINPGGIAGRDRLLSQLDIKPGTRVLEIGCGTGLTACYLATRYKCQVTAVDVSPTMIAAARQRVIDCGLMQEVYCETADIHSLPLPAASFDYVIVQAVLMFVEKARALAEIRRVLKPGGKFGAIEFAWRDIPSEEVRLRTHQICGCRVLEFHTAEDWGACLQSAHYLQVQTQEQPFALLSVSGFLRDEGIVNCLRLLGRALGRSAHRQRLAQIWGHFSQNREHFSYVILTGNKAD